MTLSAGTRLKSYRVNVLQICELMFPAAINSKRLSPRDLLMKAQLIKYRKKDIYKNMKSRTNKNRFHKKPSNLRLQSSIPFHSITISVTQDSIIENYLLSSRISKSKSDIVHFTSDKNSCIASCEHELEESFHVPISFPKNIMLDN